MTKGPLRGRRIVVTRRPEQSATLADGLRAHGAVVLEIPLIAIAPPEDCRDLDEALRRLGDYDWIAFTSANAVQAVTDRLRALSLPLRLPKVASVGPSTSQALIARLPGVAIDRQPAQDYRAEGLLAAFGDVVVSGRRFLLPLSDRARDVLAEGLSAKGARVDRIVAYRTVAARESAPALLRALAEGIDAVTFASPSSVDSFVALAPAAGVKAAVIGPVTEARAQRLGFDIVTVAQPATAEGLVDALVRTLGADY